MPTVLDVYRFYESLPGPVRAVADAAYKLVPEHMLRSNAMNTVKDELRRSQRIPLEELRMQQFLRLKDLLIHAGDTTVYYKRIFAEAGFDPRGFSHVEELQALPLLTKEDIVTHFDELRSSAYPKDKVYTIATSGSTGKYLEFVQSKEYFDREAAHTERYQDWLGMNNKSRKAIFYRGVMKRPVISDSHPPYQRFRNRLVLSQFHTDDASFAYYVEMLNDFQPEYIVIYPSTAIALTRYCAKHGGVRFKPGAIQCYSENLPEGYRREIRDYWGCKVFNRYGHGEGCISAADCEEGSMHLSIELGFTEWLRPDGSAAGPGEMSRIISTGLFTHAMPFIRYDTGDYGTYTVDACSCGRTLPVVERIDGRGDSMVYAKDGKVVSQLGGIFVKLDGVKMHQVVQEKKGELLIRVVPDDNYGPASEEKMRENLRFYAGDAFDIRFELVDDVERSPSGKIRLVISRLPKEQQYRSS